MEYIQIPVAMLDSKEFSSLKWVQQKLLIALYRRFYDTERFTVDCKNPAEYYQSKGTCPSTMLHRLAVLLSAGFIVTDGEMKSKISGRRRRVFKFKDWS
jgi:hypothetical protein